ncbi:uncharacterized protein LOC124813491 isoform X11 [Hydra vulgaris]|uniref:uncharacterized protein LOC124813491 isoform X11 n=1 Tax=Hydra vulgaris TaxID=6087 RepID=UPI001F5F4268|nr:uncharacterized protein LOC124812311 isoform X6 [Hydra vulgaris]XP_047136589.1 uncharacterized protein LOC124813491 isoform X14 [Hydra vulgaris]
MATYSKSVLDALTENPAQLFVDFLKFLESTQPITVPSTSAIRVTSSAPTITIPCVQPPAVESTQPITATFTCSTNVPSTSAICVTSSAASMTLPGIQPSAGWIQLGRKGGVWRGTCPVPYVNLYTTCICCKVRKFNLKFFIQNIIIVF